MQHAGFSLELMRLHCLCCCFHIRNTPDDIILNWLCCYTTYISSIAVFPKLVRAATQIKVAIMCQYPQYFAL